MKKKKEAPLYYYMEKADFLYFEVEASSGTNLIMFRDSDVTFKTQKKIKVRFWVITL